MSIKLTEILPNPVQKSGDEWSSVVTRSPWFKGHEVVLKKVSNSLSNAIVTRELPPYGHRKGFIPWTPEDFGAGGACPEIFTAQYPLGMGMDKPGSGIKNTVAKQFDTEGKLRFDEIARIGHSKDKIVHSRLANMKLKIIDDTYESLQKPNENEIRDTTEATRQALEKITTAKIAAALPVQHAKKTAIAQQYVRYTPSRQHAGGGAQQRIIRLVEEQKDPMEPPRFKVNQKIPRAPQSPPAPVMHSPTRKVNAKEQADWKIPPCISNWKNAKGYTVALDKRVAAADGRGLQQVHINENFAKIADTLSIAERKAREAVETRTQMERRIAQNKKREKEKRMREMAQNARMERAQAPLRKAEANDSSEVIEEAKEREQVCRDRIDEHRKERNIARCRPDKLEKLKRDKERDISENIALGLPADCGVKAAGVTQFDFRLFNQTGGLDSGGIDGETYTAYDKPWRPRDSVQQHIYRPRKNIESGIYGADFDRIISTNSFVPDKAFSGTESGKEGGTRFGPVQFERDEDDVFGLDELLQSNTTATTHNFIKQT